MALLKIYRATIPSDSRWGLVNHGRPANQADARVAAYTKTEGTRLLGFSSSAAKYWVSVYDEVTETDKNLIGMVQIRPIGAWKAPYVVADPQPPAYVKSVRYVAPELTPEEINLRNAYKAVWGHIAASFQIGLEVGDRDVKLRVKYELSEEQLKVMLDTVYRRLIGMAQ